MSIQAPQESSSPLPPIHSSLGSEETVGTGSGEAVKVHRSPGFVKKLSKELEPFIAPKQDTVIIEKSKISLSHIKEDHEVVPVTTISQNVDAAEYENPITPSSHRDSLHKVVCIEPFVAKV